MRDWQRFVTGALGGLAAASSKILAIDTGTLDALLFTGQATELQSARVAVFITTPVLMLIGGVVGWVVEETVRWKVFAIGCSAPALIAPWTAGKLEPPQRAYFEPPAIITTAFAQDEQTEPGSSTIGTGLKVLFGLESPNTQNYWVIVGSHSKLAEAEAFAAEINEAAPELNAFVGLRRPGNEYYPVIVGGTDAYLPLTEARELLNAAKHIPIVPESAYLSAYPDRVSQPN